MYAMRFSERKIVSDKLTEEKIELLKNAAYSKKAVELYVKKVNVGVIENSDVTLAYTGPCGDTCKISVFRLPSICRLRINSNSDCKGQDTTGCREDNRGRSNR